MRQGVVGNERSKWIKEWRSRMMWTQEQASAALGIQRQHYTKLETGITKPRKLYRLACERLEAQSRLDAILRGGPSR